MQHKAVAGQGFSDLAGRGTPAEQSRPNQKDIRADPEKEREKRSQGSQSLNYRSIKSETLLFQEAQSTGQFGEGVIDVDHSAVRRPGSRRGRVN